MKLPQPSDFEGHGWNDAREAATRALWADGYSASQIAKMIGGGLSRMAVIGKVHRKGWLARAKASAPQANIKFRPGEDRRRPDESKAARDLRKFNPKPKCVAPPQARKFGTNGMPLSGCKPVAPHVEATVAPDVKLVPLEGLGFNHCRWPIGDPKSERFGFCGAHTQAVYCGDHARKAFVPGAKHGALMYATRPKANGKGASA